MEFFLAPRQGGTLTFHSIYRIHIRIYGEEERDTICSVSTWSQRSSMLYRVCGGGRIEAKFPWNAKSIYPLCVLLLPAFDRPSPFKALCVSFYWTNSGSTNKKGIPFHLSPISRPTLDRCCLVIIWNLFSKIRFYLLTFSFVKFSSSACVSFRSTNEIRWFVKRESDVATHRSSFFPSN